MLALVTSTAGAAFWSGEVFTPLATNDGMAAAISSPRPKPLIHTVAVIDPALTAFRAAALPSTPKVVMLVRPACLIAASAPTVGSSKQPKMAPVPLWVASQAWANL